MNTEWENKRDKILEILNQVKDVLENKSYEAVLHYLKYDEFEIALEMLIIDLIPFSDLISQYYQELFYLGCELGLNKETVYDPSLWSQFIKLNKT